MSDIQELDLADRIRKRAARLTALASIIETLERAGIEQPTASVIATDAVASVEAHGICFARRGDA